MKRTSFLVVIGCLLISLAAAAGLAYTTVWNLAIFTLVPCGLVILGLFVCLAALILLRRAKAQEAAGLRRVSRVFLLAGLCLVVQLAYFPIAFTYRDYEIQRVKDFTHSLIPRLEEYKTTHDAYPESIEAILTSDDALPRLLRWKASFPGGYDNRQFYFQRGASYGFRFYLPDGFIGFQYEHCCGAGGSWAVTD
ncbi:MAG: hypothetical protein JXA78_08400 [Anaerolineales bacterium]|nr:hypothetical protein [Anaerolineales bacterium]